MKSLDLGTKELTRRYKQMTPGQKKRCKTIKKVVTEALKQPTVGFKRKPKLGVGLRKSHKPGIGGLSTLKKKRSGEGVRRSLSLQKKPLAAKTAADTVSHSRRAAERGDIARNRSVSIIRKQQTLNPN
jgi:hypothetical protein